MLEQLLSGRTRHPLLELREVVGVTQVQISRRTGLSCSRISLAENGLASFTPAEEKKVRTAISDITNARREAVLSEGRRR